MQVLFYERDHTVYEGLANRNDYERDHTVYEGLANRNDYGIRVIGNVSHTKCTYIRSRR